MQLHHPLRSRSHCAPSMVQTKSQEWSWADVAQELVTASGGCPGAGPVEGLQRVPPLAIAALFYFLLPQLVLPNCYYFWMGSNHIPANLGCTVTFVWEVLRSKPTSLKDWTFCNKLRENALEIVRYHLLNATSSNLTHKQIRVNAS